MDNDNEDDFDMGVTCQECGAVADHQAFDRGPDFPMHCPDCGADQE